RPPPTRPTASAVTCSPITAGGCGSARPRATQRPGSSWRDRRSVGPAGRGGPAALLTGGWGRPATRGGGLPRAAGGEPLAWILGRIDFGGIPLRIDRGVYVPRYETLELAR